MGIQEIDFRQFSILSVSIFFSPSSSTHILTVSVECVWKYWMLFQSSRICFFFPISLTNVRLDLN